MTLKDLMRDDITNVFHNTSEFADNCRFVVKGGDVGFAAIILFADPNPNHLEIDGTQEDHRSAEAMLSRVAIRTGISTIEGKERDPIKGDALEVLAGPYLGIWTIQSIYNDDGDGITVQIIKAENYALGIRAREVRS